MNSDVERTQDEEKAQRLRPLAEPLVRMLQRVSGLDDFWAKVCVYYAIATHALPRLALFPILVFKGGPGFGKSSAIEVLQRFVREPVPLSGASSTAVLRDRLGSNTTAVIEEADKVDESIIRDRYSRVAGTVEVNRQGPPGVWRPVLVEFFGATVLHRREVFEDSAIDSRSILVGTREKPGEYASIEELENDLAGAAANARTIAENCRFERPRKGRTEDVWGPLLAVAEALMDTEWLEQCRREIEKAANILKWSHGLEPDQAVVCALIALYHGPLVPLSDIRDWIKKELDQRWSTWKVGRVVRALGFEVKKSGGREKVTVDKESVKLKARELGIDDDTLNGLGNPKIRGLD